MPDLPKYRLVLVANTDFECTVRLPYPHKALAEQLQVFNGMQYMPGDIVGVALDGEKLLCLVSHPVNDANVGPLLRQIAEPIKNAEAKQFDRPNLSGPFVGL